MINHTVNPDLLDQKTKEAINAAILSQVDVDVVWTGTSSFKLENIRLNGSNTIISEPTEDLVPHPAQVLLEPFPEGAVAVPVGDDCIVMMYKTGNLKDSDEDYIKSAHSFWESWCKDNIHGPRKGVRLHVRFGREVTESPDGKYHYVVGLNRSVDRVFTPVTVIA